MGRPLLAINGFEKSPTNTRIYITKAHGTTWKIFKKGHGRKQLHTGKLGKSTKRFVAVQQIPRGGVIVRPTLHEVLAMLDVTERQAEARRALGLPD